MPRIEASISIVLTALALRALPVHAQAAKPDTAKPLKVTAGVAFLDASGNTDVTTLSINERLEWTRPHFLWTQSINGINSSTDGEESANLLAIGLRGDWKPKGRLSVYSLVNFDRNRFADIRRRFEEGLGLGYRLVDRTHHRLTTELGLNLAGVERVLELEQQLERATRRLQDLENRSAQMREEMEREIEAVRRSFRAEIVPYRGTTEIVPARPRPKRQIPIERG